jgi:hypothetical protein
MKIVSGSLVRTLQQFIKDTVNIDLDDAEISAKVRELKFSENLELVDALKADNIEEILSILQIDNVESMVDEDGYGTTLTTQPAASTIKSQNTAINNANRRANNAQQDANRDMTVAQRTVAGGNKAPTGAPNRTNTIPDPDDQERAQNAQVAGGAANQAAANAAEIERLKQLVYGRR